MNFKQESAQVRLRAVSFAAAFWGLVVFLPVGMNYLGLLMLLLTVLASGTLGQRLKRMREHPTWWPAMFFLGWTLVVLALQPNTYRETPGNLWHGFRIVVTILLTLSLDRDEAWSAMKGLAVAFAAVVLLLVGYYVGLVPPSQHWDHLFNPATNKTISASILFCMLAAAASVLCLTRRSQVRVVAYVVLAAALVVVMVALSKRTAMIGFALAAIAIAFHQWRTRPTRLLPSVLAASLLVVGLFTAVPSVNGKIQQGVREAQSALDGRVALESWNIRIQMIRHTSDMILERPLLGWGIGAWNDQWRQRVPEILAGFNMPHNDLLWMGAQAGVPGALAWLMLMLSTCWAGWKNQRWEGRIAFALGVLALFSSLVNNGTRDAELALPMLFMLGVAMAFAREPQTTGSAGAWLAPR